MDEDRGSTTPPAELRPLESDELEPEVIKSDGRYRVTFPLGCAVCASTTAAVLDPNDARYLAYQLTKAAEEADAKNEP
jgi:hypothetical protein